MVKIAKILILISSLSIVFNCKTMADEATDAARAIAWMQTSAEYQAILSQTFKTAANQLQLAVFDESWTAAIEQFGQKGLNQLPNAIILDLDETLVNTLSYHASLVLNNNKHDDKRFQNWMNIERAPIVPHVMTLIEKAASLGVTVLLISDRVCKPTPRDPCPVKTQTLRMLKRISLAFPKDQMFFRGEYSDWNKDQTSRREFIAKRYRILMIVGDDINQMIPQVSTLPMTAREKLTAQYDEMWGSRWFIVPNPVYGSWLDILPNDIKKSLDPKTHTPMGIR